MWLAANHSLCRLRGDAVVLLESQTFWRTHLRVTSLLKGAYNSVYVTYVLRLCVKTEYKSAFRLLLVCQPEGHSHAMLPAN